MYVAGKEEATCKNLQGARVREVLFVVPRSVLLKWCSREESLRARAEGNVGCFHARASILLLTSPTLHYSIHLATDHRRPEFAPSRPRRRLPRTRARSKTGRPFPGHECFWQHPFSASLENDSELCLKLMGLLIPACILGHSFWYSAAASTADGVRAPGMKRPRHVSRRTVRSNSALPHRLNNLQSVGKRSSATRSTPNNYLWEIGFHSLGKGSDIPIDFS